MARNAAEGIPYRARDATEGIPYRDRNRRNAFSLIEVILAIALSSTLLVLLTGSIGLYLFRVEASRSAVEQGQLARGVLQLIASDLRSAAVLYEQDTSVTEALSASQESFDANELDQLPDDQTETTESSRPITGIFGDAVSIQVDIHKARAADPAVTFGNKVSQAAPTTLSGISSVRYLLANQGLVRQEISREQVAWEEDQGATGSWETSSKIIAPEVVSLQLAYYDGDQLQPDWDSQEQDGALPTAIEVQLTFRYLDEEVPSQPATQTTSRSNSENQTLRSYRIIVAIPEALTKEEASESEEGSQF